MASDYRALWFRNNTSKDGLYKCSCCGQHFNKKDIDIDHIIPKSKGGTNEIWNLQPMCKHCNRSKQASLESTAPDLIKSVASNVLKGNKIDNIGLTVGNIIKVNTAKKISKAVGIKNSRKGRPRK